MFQIIVNEITDHNATQPIERLRQTVDTLDLLELINIVNKKPKKPRADKGTKRGEAKTL